MRDVSADNFRKSRTVTFLPMGKWVFNLPLDIFCVPLKLLLINHHCVWKYFQKFKSQSVKNGQNGSFSQYLRVLSRKCFIFLRSLPIFFLENELRFFWENGFRRRFRWLQDQKFQKWIISSFHEIFTNPISNCFWNPFTLNCGNLLSQSLEITLP